MKKSILPLSILFLFSFLFSCNETRYRDAESFSLSDIQERIQLTGEIIDCDEIIMPRYLFLKDSLLFTINMRQVFHVSVFHLRDMKRIGDFIEFGNGPNEALIVDNLQFQDSIVWAIDLNRRQINSYHLNQFFEEKEIKPREILKTGESFQKILVARDKLIANSLLHIQSRLSFYDLQGNFIANHGELPDAGIEMTDMELYESYFCNMALNPVDESIFVTYMGTDLIEIYDANGNLKTRKHGPDRFFPYKRERTITDGDEEMIQVGFVAGKSREAYFCPVAFEDEIWTLYNGKYMDPNIVNGFMCNHIIVFDWDGNPLRHYTTDIAFYGLAIDRINKVIYGVTINPEFTFVKFKY